MTYAGFLATIAGCFPSETKEVESLHFSLMLASALEPSLHYMAFLFKCLGQKISNRGTKPTERNEVNVVNFDSDLSS